MCSLPVLMVGRMICPYLKECFKEWINRKHDFFEKERCTRRERWSNCPVFKEKEEEKPARV